MILSVGSGGGYSLRACTETGDHGAGGEEGALPVAVGVLGSGGAASVEPG